MNEIFNLQSVPNVAQYPGVPGQATIRVNELAAHTDLFVLFHFANIVLNFSASSCTSFLPPCTYYIIRSGWLADWFVGL